MIRKVAFTMYPVTDVPRARRFYEQTLGLKPGLAGNAGDSWWVEYDLPGGGCLALTDITGDKPSDSAGKAGSSARSRPKAASNASMGQRVLGSASSSSRFRSRVLHNQ